MHEDRITSRQNPLLRHVKKLLTSHAYRASCGAYAGDGVKLLAEAARWEAGLQLVIAVDGLDPGPLPDGVRLVRVPPDVMESLSLMQAPQGVLFVCSLPMEQPLRVTPGCLILDGIQDPGNLGTILRTADALSVPAVLLDGCADPYSPKVVRASMGAVFRMTPQRTDLDTLAAQCRALEIPLIATALTDQAEDLRRVSLAKGAVIIGSEGHGIRPELLRLADRTVIIPMASRCESLNAAVAATIVMWEMRR